MLVKAGQDVGIRPSTSRPFLISKCVYKFAFRYLSTDSKDKKNAIDFFLRKRVESRALPSEAADAITHRQGNLVTVYWPPLHIYGKIKEVRDIIC